MALKDEIREQPKVLAHLLDTQWDTVCRAAEAIRQRDPRYAFLAARGTSDHAGIYAKYLWGSHNGLPLALAATSLFSIYEEAPKLRDAFVVGISQSGQSPDILSVVKNGRDQGCLTLAITNCPDSPMGHLAEHVLDISAGPENAVAATKTYTAQLMAIAMLSAAMEGGESRLQELRGLPAAIEQVLELDGAIERIAERYRYIDQCVVLGRGYNYATAFEWSLKLKELAYVVAEPYSSADFQHGPIAIVGPGFPVFAVAPKDRVLPDMLKLLRRLKDEFDAELLVVSDDEEALSLAKSPILVPSVPQWLSPIVHIVACQMFCYHLTRAKGYDTEQPRGLSKVTKTS